MYITVGILGALAIPNVRVNMLEPMVSGAYGKGLQLSGSLFAFFIIGLDIPCKSYAVVSAPARLSLKFTNSLAFVSCRQ